MTTSRILCVHESGTVLHELEQTLIESGCDVLLAKDSLSAVRILDREHVDGVVLSFNMEGPDGRALRNQIRHICPDMPVLLFSEMEEIRDVPLHVFSAYLRHQEVGTLAGIV